MKNYIFLFGLILMSNIYMINSKYIDVIKPTNYTLNTLTSIENTKPINCGLNDSMCSSDYQCILYKYDNYSSYYCARGDFLCINDDNFHCIQTDTNFYKLRYYSYNNTYYRIEKELSDEIRPIIETCSKKSVDDNSCKLSMYCENNSDCLSGNCYKNYCISEKPIYLCTDSINDDIHSMKCGKHAYMECEKDSDCFSNKCINGICGIEIDDEPEYDNTNCPLYFLGMTVIVANYLFALVIILAINISCCWCFYRIKKSKKNINGEK